MWYSKHWRIGSIDHDMRLSRITSVRILRCLDHKRLQSLGRVVLGVIRMFQLSQIEGPKFGWFRNKPIFSCTDQCKCYCFHISASLFLFFDWSAFVLRPLRDNHYFLFHISKSDVRWRKRPRIRPCLRVSSRRLRSALLCRMNSGADRRTHD